MKVLFALAVKSVLSRRLTAGLTILSVAVSVALLVGVDRIRTEARAGFANTISGADLIVGARGGPLNLLLYSIFRIGDATSGISWESYEDIAARPEVAWTIPLSLGDSHRGYRVLGTTGAYFEHYRYGRDRRLEIATGAGMVDMRDAVLGADVAEGLGYAVGDSIVVSHGIGDVSFEHHDDLPLAVAGILGRTGTPVDRTVHVTLAAIEAIHDDDGAHDEHDHGDDHDDHDADAEDAEDAEVEGHADHDDGHADEHADEDHGEHSEDDHAAHHDDEHADDDHHDEHGDDDHADHGEEHADEHNDEHADDDHADRHGDEHADEHDHEHADDDHGDDHTEPDSITAFIVGLTSRPLALVLQRHVNEYAAEPLMAIVPGVALQQLWQMLGVAEAAMLGISILVVIAGLIGMMTTFLTSLTERRREMAVLRATGAGPGLVFALLIVEALLLAAVASLIGVAFVHGAMLVARPVLLAEFGLALAGGAPGLFDLLVVAAVTLAGGVVAAVPAWRAYRYSLADGLTMRV